MTYTRTSLTAALPVDITTALTHVRLEADDAFRLAPYIEAAAGEIEDYCGLALLAQTINCTTAEQPSAIIALPVGPVAIGAVATVATLEADGTSVPMLTGHWLEAGRYPRLHITGNEPASRLSITYTAGYGATAAALPDDLAHAVADQAAGNCSIRQAGHWRAGMGYRWRHRVSRRAIGGWRCENGPNAASPEWGRNRCVHSSFFPTKKSGEDIAATAIDFLQTLIVPEGPLAGKPVVLAEYQKRFIRGAMADGVMVGLLSIGRGNAKTSTTAGIGLGALMGVWDDQPKREIIIAACNREQAKTAFQFVAGFIEGLPEAEQELFTVRRGYKLEVEYAANGGGLLRVVPADGKSILGGAPTLAILDETAAWKRDKGDALENAILSGLGKRNGRALIISTSAPDDMNTFSRWMDDAPPGTYVQEHRPPPGLPADDLDSLLIANPGAAEGIGATPEWLVAQARRAIARGGTALSSFRNLNRNERCNTDDRSVLVTVDEWLSAEVAPDALPERAGPCVLGIDLGGSRSMSAAAFYWPDTGRLEPVGTSPAMPSLADRGAADTVAGLYTEMHGRGELSVMGENTVPPGPWLAAIVRHLDGASVACVVGDRFRHAEFVEAMNAAGLRAPFVWRGFGWKDGSENIERFRRTLFDGLVKVAPSLLLRSSFGDAITLVDPAGNHKLAKSRSFGRIDAAAATVLAVAQGARMKATQIRKARAAWA